MIRWGTKTVHGIEIPSGVATTATALAWVGSGELIGLVGTGEARTGAGRAGCCGKRRDCAWRGSGRVVLAGGSTGPGRGEGHTGEARGDAANRGIVLLDVLVMVLVLINCGSPVRVVQRTALHDTISVGTAGASSTSKMGALHAHPSRRDTGAHPVPGQQLPQPHDFLPQLDVLGHDVPQAVPRILAHDGALLLLDAQLLQLLPGLGVLVVRLGQLGPGLRAALGQILDLRLGLARFLLEGRHFRLGLGELSKHVSRGAVGSPVGWMRIMRSAVLVGEVCASGCATGRFEIGLLHQPGG